MRILIPTDFSECASHAIHAGIELVKKFNGHIDVVHFLDDSTSFMSSAFPEGYDPIMDLVQKNMAKLDRVLKIQDISHETMVKNTSMLTGMTELLQSEQSYDLIIMGSHGQTGYDQWYLGSNTQKAIRKLNCKVLIIKEELASINFEEVLFVTGLDSDDKLAFLHFLDFIKPFNPKKIHILTIDTSSYFSQPATLMLEVLDDFKNLAKDVNCETHFYPNYSVENGVQEFTSENKIDLISISNHIKHPIKRLFRGSNVEAIANQSFIPVLTIDFITEAIDKNSIHESNKSGIDV